MRLIFVGWLEFFGDETGNRSIIEFSDHIVITLTLISA